MSKREVTYIDSETRGVQYLFDLPPREQFRLGQWAVGREGEVHLTEDYDEWVSVIENADILCGHNLFYDLMIAFGKDSMRPLELALEGRLLDTYYLYFLHFRIPMFYETAGGRKACTYQDGKQKPERVKAFLSLGNLTHHHGLPGKSGDLVEIAREFNPPKTKKEDLDFGLIPLDHPEFREYAKNDIVALRALAQFIQTNTDLGGITPYDYREMIVLAINDQMSKNGIRVDVPEAERRVKELDDKRAKIMSWLVEEFDFPTKGKSPWRSHEGQGAILKAFDTFGIRPEGNPDWTRSEKTGAPSFSKSTLMAVSEGTEAEELAEAIVTLQGQRPLAQLALDSLWSDGLAHPNITALQRSGRFSMTDPSLPIWGEREDHLKREKEYFIPKPGHKFLEGDFSNADQRIVAAMSGDSAYAKRFEPGADGHEISGRLMFGDEVYDSDPKRYRETSKALSHGYSYGAGPKTLAKTSGLPEVDEDGVKAIDLARTFVDVMDSTYPWNRRWRERMYEEGLSGWVTNTWGRRMSVDKDRSFTMSPGLMGQSGTREILMDGLIAIARDKIEVLRWLVATVHDAFLFDIPETEIEWAVPYIQSKMERTYDHTEFSNIGQAIFFPVSFGKPADNWKDAGH